MKFLLLSLASLSLVRAQCQAAEDAELSAILADVKDNQSDYFALVTSSNPPPSDLLNLVVAAMTYTDDGYTSLYSSVDIDEVKSYISGLSWYSSRLQPEIESATQGLCSSAESSVACSSSSSPASSSSSTSSSAAASSYSSAAASSSAAPSSTASSSGAASSSSAAASSSEPASSSAAPSSSSAEPSSSSPESSSAAPSSSEAPSSSAAPSSSEVPSSSSPESSTPSSSTCPGADDAELSAILADLQAHQSDYLGQASSGNAPPAALLNLVEQVLTYTDDSYTTLYGEVDIDQVNSYITGLPWYSSRLSAEIASATDAVCAASSAPESSSPESSMPPSSSAPESSSPASSSTPPSESSCSPEAAKDAELSAILADLDAHQSDYLGQISAGNAPPAALLNLVEGVLTYTDDSYTTLYSDVDLDQVNSYITGLPWYSSRLAGAIASATASVCAGSASSSTPEETPYISGYLQDGQPHWDVHIPGSLGPWTSVDFAGSNPGSPYAFVSAELTVDGSSVDVDVTVSDDDYSVSYDVSIDSSSELVLSVDASATAGEPYTNDVTVTITTDAGKRLRYVVKRATTTYDLSSTISENASGFGSSSSSSESGSGSGLETSTSTVDEQSTTLVTITSCSDNACSETVVPTGVTVVTTTESGWVTEYTTYCPLTTTGAGESTTVLTITSCSDNACETSEVTTGVSVVHTTVEGVVTVYTTYCPITGTETSPSTPETAAPGTTAPGAGENETSTVQVAVTTTVAPGGTTSGGSGGSGAGTTAGEAGTTAGGSGGEVSPTSTEANVSEYAGLAGRLEGGLAMTLVSMLFVLFG